MKQEYIITNDILREKGLDLDEYTIDGAYVNTIINIALDLLITRILYLNDDFYFEEDIEKALDSNEKLIKPFMKLQHRMIYNLVFFGDAEPIDMTIDSIIAHDLRWGKINGFQKGVFRR